MALKQPTAIVVGAGPSGCAVSAGLAKRGWKVHCFERRPEPKDSEGSSSRGYPMTLNSRSTKALEEIGVESSILGKSGRVQKGSLWAGNYLPALYPTEPKEEEYILTYIVDRTQLGNSLYKGVKELCSSLQNSAQPSAAVPGSVTWHFNSTLSDLDVTHKTATFAQVPSSSPSPSSSPPSHPESDPPQGKSMEVRSQSVTATYDLLVGADGQSSRTRQLLQEWERLDGHSSTPLTVEPMYQEEVFYKTAHGLALPEAGSGKEAEALEAAFPGITTSAPGEVMYAMVAKGKPGLVMWKQAGEGGKNCTMSTMLVRVPSYERKVFEEQLASGYPQVPSQWVTSIVDQAAEPGPQPPAPFARLLKLSKLHGPSIALVGDAGHPTTSSLGQGCNVSLESARVFLEVLDAQGGDPEKTGPAFTAARLADVHAFQTLEYTQLIISGAQGMDKLPSWTRNALTAPIFMTMAVGSLLHKYLPSLFPHPILYYAWVKDARRPFSKVLLDLRALFAVVGGTGVVLAAAILYWAGSSTYATLAG